MSMTSQKNLSEISSKCVSTNQAPTGLTKTRVGRSQSQPHRDTIDFLSFHHITS